MIPIIGISPSLGGSNENSNHAADYIFNNAQILKKGLFQKEAIFRADSTVLDKYLSMNRLFTSVAEQTCEYVTNNSFFTAVKQGTILQLLAHGAE